MTCDICDKTSWGWRKINDFVLKPVLMTLLAFSLLDRCITILHIVYTSVNSSYFWSSVNTQMTLLSLGNFKSIIILIWKRLCFLYHAFKWRFIWTLREGIGFCFFLFFSNQLWCLFCTLTLIYSKNRSIIILMWW